MTDLASLAAPDLGRPRRSATYLGRDESTLLALAATLVAIGLVMVYSTSAVRADLRIGDETWFLRKQGLWTALAGLSVVLVWQTDADWIKRRAFWIFGAIMVALVLVLVPGIGTNIRGSQRWIRLLGLSIQPSEVAKYGVILFAAAYASRPGDPFARFKTGFIPAFGIVGLAAVLVARQPDLGTAAFIGTTGVAVLVAGGMRLRHLVPVAMPVVAGAVVVAMTFQHVQDRLLAFLEPEATASGAGYQVRQSLLALGSGGLVGNGLGDGRQKWLFLPDEHTDFILAIVGEEMGFVGTAFVVGLYIAILVYGARVMMRCQDRFRFLVVFGVTFAIGLQAAMNVAVVTASMPTKGISLPFVSFGGSSLVASALGVGLILSMAREPERPSVERPKTKPAVAGRSPSGLLAEGAIA